MAEQGRLDVILWAHSDQQGGTEMPCVIASALVRRTGFKIRCGIVTPFPEIVVEFFKLEGGFKSCIEVIPGPRLLDLAKSSDGKVNKDKTANKVKSLIRDYAFEKDKKTKLSEDDATNAFDGIVKKCVDLVKNRLHPKTLFISCGEAVAVAVAKQVTVAGKKGLEAIIITDHLTRHSVAKLLESEKLAVERFIRMHKKAEEAADAVYLLPPEFGHPDYKQEFKKDTVVMETSGLLYDPIPEHELIAAPHYPMLKEINEEHPIVIVFGGGGTVWDEFVVALHEQSNKLTNMSLLLKDKFKDTDGKTKLSRRTWRLYKPGDTKGQKLSDPGRLIYWYHACTLLLGRGGLAAQQILAATLARPSKPPAMIFVNELHHPQINAEWDLLAQMKLVNAVEFDVFQQTLGNNYSGGAIGFIENYIEKEKERRDFRRRVAVRYSEGAVDRLADSILGAYSPIAANSTVSCRFDDGREFLEMLGDFIRFKDIGSAPRPFLLQVMVPDSSENGSSADLEILKKVVVSFKEKVKTIFFSKFDSSGDRGLSGDNFLKRTPDPLLYGGMPVLMEKAREGVGVNIGIETMLNADFSQYSSSIDKLFANPGPQDYINIFLDAGTQKTYENVWRGVSWQQLMDNLARLLSAKKEQKDYVHIQLLYGLKKINCGDDDINGALGLLLNYEGIDRLIFSYNKEDDKQKETAESIDKKIGKADGRIQLIRRRNWKESNFQSCSACLFFPTVLVENGEARFCACPNALLYLNHSSHGSCTWSSSKKTPFDAWKEDVPGKEDVPEKKWKKFAGDLPAKCGRICSQKAGTINAMSDAMLTGIRMIG